MIATCTHTTALVTIMSKVLPWLLVAILVIVSLTAFGFTRRIRNKARAMGADLRSTGLSWSALLLGGTPPNDPLQ